MRSGEVPWLPRLLQALDLRRTDRCLLIEPPDVATARAVAFAAGRKGELTVVTERRAAAIAIAEALPEAEVSVGVPGANLSLGVFDAVLCTALARPPSDLAGLAAFVARSLRPGGRFAVDLPSPEPWPDLAAAAAESRGSQTLEVLARSSGPSVETLARALGERSLRRVEPLLAAHLVPYASPFEAVIELAAALTLPEDERQALALAFARLRESTGPVEVRAMRSTCAGMR